MEEKTRCEICDRNFKDEEGLLMHNQSKHPELVPKEKKPFPVKKVKNWSIFILMMGLIIFGTYFLISSSLNAISLPPTDIIGHIEQSPKSHILKEPMPISIQKHMLEHVDGKENGRGGVIINYDCENFECEFDLVERLEQFAIKYNYVYVAPFKNMQNKIALTKIGQIETLDEFDESVIENFLI